MTDKDRIAEMTRNEAPRQAAERIIKEWDADIAGPLFQDDLDSLKSAILTAIQNASNAQLDRGRANDIREYNERQRQWSRKTFGDGKRTRGLTAHVRKELAEIEAKPEDLEEWIDVVILALDGAWRAGGTPEGIIAALAAKLRQRGWDVQTIRLKVQA